MTWSGEQQRLLAAMGYVLYRRTGGATADAAAGFVDPPEHDRLWQALRRAACGRDPRPLGLPPLAQLRTDPAAKRALWPRLRALRRS
ncbi:hypothetical protein P873_07515 [Arenimonas composti TR7-09 = DSM 18010]|uniref:Uncharacterized protein n=1 Tax=Arenimonas composti TR7-09 = DSM 18010 TaxID=1121013 RepID=A0A091BEM6_9GAMM|nr:hypothetical protein [Arenimonas composti]KFN50196.1 hypothetical protein P873_07515 [Arenimonas composti TR7-09 = DSM 18010]